MCNFADMHNSWPGVRARINYNLRKLNYSRKVLCCEDNWSLRRCARVIAGLLEADRYGRLRTGGECFWLETVMFELEMENF